MIKAVLFDMGGTLEDLYSCEVNERRTAEALWEILKKYEISVPFDNPYDLWKICGAQILECKKHCEKTMREFKPEEIWPDWAFRGIDVDREKVIAASEEMAHMWEVTYYDRKLRDHAAEMLKGLKELGLYVGVVSNTASLFQVYDTLEEYGVRDYFDGITLSSVTGYRKPSQRIFDIAFKQARLSAAECAYVGDTFSRDVVGARDAGFGEVFKISSFLTPLKDLGDYTGYAPDHEITDIYEVYTILKEELGK